MGEFFRKNWWAWCLILIIIIVILAILRLMGGSTWFEGWGLQLIDWGWFWGQRPLKYTEVGVLSFGVMIALIIIIIVIIYFLRDTFRAKG